MLVAIGITLTYGGSSIRLERFSGAGAQRSYVDSATLNFGVTGSAIQSGSSRNVRRVWTINTVAEREATYALEDLYEAWDTARATGAIAVVTLVDEVTASTAGTAITATTVFSEPLTIELFGNGSPLYRVSFGLTEV